MMLSNIIKYVVNSAILITLSLLFCNISFANDELPNIQHGLSYKVARKYLLNMGYIPFINAKEKQCSTIDERCRAYPEILFCTSDELLCVFEWKSKNRKIINVTTEGEQLKDLKIHRLWWPSPEEIPAEYR